MLKSIETDANLKKRIYLEFALKWLGHLFNALASNIADSSHIFNSIIIAWQLLHPPNFMIAKWKLSFNMYQYFVVTFYNLYVDIQYKAKNFWRPTLLLKASPCLVHISILYPKVYCCNRLSITNHFSYHTLNLLLLQMH